MSQIPSFSGPAIVDLEVSGRCQCACEFCQAGHALGMPTRTELSTEHYLRVLGALSAAGVMSVFLTGGEPFLNPDFLTIYKAAASLGLEPVTSTNGIAVGTDFANALRLAGARTIQVSIHGTRRIHDSIVGMQGAWEAAMRGVKLLSEAGLFVEIAFVGTAKNLSCCPDLIREAKAAGAHVVRVLRYMLRRKDELLLRAPEKAVEGIFAECISAAEESGISLLFSACPGGQGENALPSRVHPMAHFCPAGKTRMYVASSGEVYPCVMFRGVSEFCVGRLPDDDVRGIWESDLLGSFRRLGPNDYEGDCGKCWRKYSCYSCRYIAWLFDGTIRGDDHSCYLLTPDRR